MAATTREPKMVPFNQIKISENLNSRQNLHGIKDLAGSIQEVGLLSALIVTNGGDDKHPYTLSAGYRRAAALKHLNWGSKPVPVIVVEDNALANLVENIERDDLHPLDLAERLSEMVSGTYATPEGVEPRAWERKELAQKANLSLPSISNYVRVHEKICAEVKKMLRGKDVPRVPLRLLFDWATKNEEAQIEAATEWLKANEGGTKRKKRTSKEEKEAAEKAELGLVRGAKNFEAVTDAIKVLQHKIEAVKSEKEKALYAGMFDSLRWVAGKVKNIPNLSQEDYDAVFPPAEEEEEESGEE